jgi:hypothetical protein
MNGEQRRETRPAFETIRLSILIEANVNECRDSE